MANELRILVAEDDKTTREAWRELIGTWGFKVQTVDDGALVVEAVQSFDPDILLLDLKLPGKDGITVLRELHELGLRIATIVISDFTDAVQTIELGAYDYLRKPIDPAHLCVLLNHLSSHINTAEENQRLRRQLIECGELGPIVGQSIAIRRVMRLPDGAQIHCDDNDAVDALFPEYARGTVVGSPPRLAIFSARNCACPCSSGISAWNRARSSRR